MKLRGVAVAAAMCAVAICLPTAAQQAAQPPTATFQLQVDYVEVDATVTDSQGNFVRDLTRDDFQLLDDGKPQKIESFSLVQIPTDRQSRIPGSTTLASTDVRSNRQAAEGRLYVLLLDDMGTSALRSAAVIRAAREFVEQHFGPNDVAAVVFTSGRVDASQEFTGDRQRLLTAISKFVGNKLRSSTLDKLDGYYQQQAAAAASSAQGGQQADPSADPAQAANTGGAPRTYDVNDVERGSRALRVLGQLKNVADFLSAVRGRRKALLLFSEGIDYPVNDIFAAHEASSVLRATEDAITAAARGNVNFFTIDPRGLVGMSSEYMELSGSSSELQNVGARDSRYGLQPQTALLAEMRQTQDSLRTLAEETGGFASVDRNSFQQAFDRIVQANSVYYVLGYPPQSRSRDGRFHKIEVRVNRPGMHVVSRKGYASLSVKAAAEREKTEQENLATASRKGSDHTSPELRRVLDKPMQQSGLTIAVHAAPFRNSARDASVALAVEIDGQRLSFAPVSGNSVFADKLELSLFTINDRSKPLQGLRTEFELNLRPESYKQVKALGVRMNPRLLLAPGRYQLRVGARESGAGELGSVFYDLDVPDFTREPVMISGLLITAPSAQRVPTLQSDPAAVALLSAAATTRREFSRDDVLEVYAEIYDNIPPQDAHRIEATTSLVGENGEKVFSAREFLGGDGRGLQPATYGQPHRISLKDVPAGRYVLRIEAEVRGKNGVKPAVRESPLSVVAAN